MNSTGKRYAFIPPRFGKGIAGGAETLVGELARHLAARGDFVDVLTTCASDNRTWENTFPAGVTDEDGITVRRFPVDPRNLDVWIPHQIAISEGMSLSVEDQLDWMAESVNSSGLYQWIAEQGTSYDAMFFAPYLFGTTFWGALIHPENSFLIPCLHDEYYAYVDVIQSLFRQVKGCLFNAIPEMELARTLYGRVPGGEVGMGFDRIPDSAKKKLTPYFTDGSPYLLYVGRKETGKNAQLLVDYFVKLKDEGKAPHDLKLVIVGGGSFSDLGRDEALLRGDVVDCAHVDEEDKRRLLRHAVCLCQPSRNESFSIVMMESWLLERPVLVHALCAVTHHHVVESGGGLFFATYDDFAGAVIELLAKPELGSTMGRAGEEYVRNRYDWKVVLKRFDAVMSSFEGSVQLTMV